jgi:UDP-N-acetyl-D-glucosamine dehydrogenase
MDVAVLGQGYVGLPLAMAAVKAGHNVVGFEPDRARHARLVNADSYVEDVPSLTLQAALASGRYRPTRSDNALYDFDVAVITVPTPLKDGVPDLSYVREATQALGRYVHAGATVILESTTYPGTTRDVVVPILEDLTGMTAGTDFFVGFSPERIDPGNLTYTFNNTPKIVSGLTNNCLQRVSQFYNGITQSVVLAGTLEEAELAKVYENTYRQVNIALANELQRHAHTLGVDPWNVIALAETKPFGFTAFWPGPGVGGHCLPVDPVYLSHHLRTQHGDAFQLVELAQTVNESQPTYVVDRLQDALNKQGQPLHGTGILALGVAYKADTADMRESPAARVIELLEAKGAIVTSVDPSFEKEDENHLTTVPDAGDYDAVVLLTAHTAFDLQHVAAHATYVLDTRGVMPYAPHIERL